MWEKDMETEIWRRVHFYVIESLLLQRIGYVPYDNLILFWTNLKYEICQNNDLKC